MNLAALLPLVALVGMACTVSTLILTRRDRFGDHWRTEAEALLAENDRLRQRMDDLEKSCAAQLAALKVENDALGQRIIALVRAGAGP